MNAQYKHSQPGYLMIIVGVVLIAIGAIVFDYGLRLLWMPIGVGVFILVFGYKLTVEIKDGFLRFWFGPGIFWKKVPLEQITYCEPFKSIVCGWGFRITPDGWLYNVSGMKAVTLVLKSGKKIHLGTDEPVRLVEAVNSALRPMGRDNASGMWAEIKTDYLRRVEQALSAARHPRSFEILADIGSHLDQRFAELPPQQRTWDTFQKIITEMGPPAEYTELVGQQQATDKAILSAGYVIALTLILAGVAVGMIFLPKMLKPNDAGVTKQANVMPTNGPEVATAIEAAKSWLQLVDDGEYEQSWEQAAEFFKKNVSQEQWKTALDGVRKPIGKMLSREVMTSTYMTEVPGAPDGKYVVIQFKTSFENKQNAVETVTPMLEPGGQWRVSGYYIK